MEYTKEQLIKLGSEKIRNNPGLFSLFQKYVQEDICELYHDCKLPNNCFGCSFNTTFSRWRTHILNNENNSKRKKIMSNSKITYELKDNKTRLFFDEEVLDKNSTDEQWNKFINYPSDPDRVKKRKELFAKLPNSKSDEKPAKAKTPKTKPAAKSKENIQDTIESNPGVDPEQATGGEENTEKENSDNK